MAINVFISHVASESEIAIWIKKEIKGLLGGVVEFFVSSDGEHIVGGDKWLDKILNALKKSDIVLVLCSEESVHRPWVNFEAGGAWMDGKRVVPLCHGGMEPGKLPQPLAALQAYSLRNPQDIERLVSLLAESAGVRPPEFDANALIRTLPPHTNTESLGSPGQRKPRTSRDVVPVLDQPIDRSDYVFDKRIGIYRHVVTQETVCTNCLLEGRVSPLSETPEGWICHFGSCREFYANPDFNPPRDDYDPLTHGRL